VTVYLLFTANGQYIICRVTSCDKLSFIYSKWAVYYLSEELRVTVYLLFTANGEYIIRWDVICVITTSFVYSKWAVHFLSGSLFCNENFICFKLAVYISLENFV
jgi:hypothetical protein